MLLLRNIPCEGCIGVGRCTYAPCPTLTLPGGCVCRSAREEEGAALAVERVQQLAKIVERFEQLVNHHKQARCVGVPFGPAAMHYACMERCYASRQLARLLFPWLVVLLGWAGCRSADANSSLNDRLRCSGLHVLLTMLPGCPGAAD